MEDSIMRRRLGWALPPGALAAAPPGPASDGSARADIEAAVQALRALMIDPDRGRLEALAFETLGYGHSNGWVETRDGFIGNLQSGASDFVSIELSNQTVQIYGDTAIVRHDLDAQTNDGGKPGQVALHVMLVWLRDAGGWRLAARQAARRPA